MKTFIFCYLLNKHEYLPSEKEAALIHKEDSLGNFLYDGRVCVRCKRLIFNFDELKKKGRK